jgi:hypothetical protein
MSERERALVRLLWKAENALYAVGGLFYKAGEFLGDLGGSLLRAYCADCGLGTLASGEFYMLRDAVWLDANLEGADYLCFGCVRTRLGRELRQSDFTTAPLNFENPDVFAYWKGLEP